MAGREADDQDETPDQIRGEAMFVVSVALTALGAAGATVAAVREVPRYARWYRRATQS
jgi:hypothetical protein